MIVLYFKTQYIVIKTRFYTDCIHTEIALTLTLSPSKTPQGHITDSLLNGDRGIQTEGQQ
jgi:hypothetical protein